MLPNIYTAYRVAKQSGDGISFPELFALGVDSTGFSLASSMIAYQVGRPDVRFPVKAVVANLNASSTATVLPVWRQSMANGGPVVLRQTAIWAYGPVKPSF
ncbi:MAG: hypothetical protein QE263_01525 [Vampirovibrionales bacterium]|nr:hypothetical protein [Vampirovibrionales bacterium]